MSEKVVPAPRIQAAVSPVELVEKERKAEKVEKANHRVAPYKGFVAGVFSGITKLAGMYVRSL